MWYNILLFAFKIAFFSQILGGWLDSKFLEFFWDNRVNDFDKKDKDIKYTYKLSFFNMPF